MACEIELKAHVGEAEIDAVAGALDGLSGSTALGSVDKYDVYWSTEEDAPPVFRTRLQTSGGSAKILFTSKPLKKKDYSTEYNVENEFEAPADQWEKIDEFARGLGYVVCRRKWKAGRHWEIERNGFKVHAELLDVRYLGWFIEIEICGGSLEEMDVKAAEKTLFSVLEASGVSRLAVEPRGYNKMLAALKKEKG